MRLRLLFQLSLQLATAVDGAVERGGKQAEGQKERQSEVDDADGDVAAPGHVLDADDLHFRENAHGRRCDAQPEAAQKRHQGHVVPGNAIRLGDARMGVVTEIRNTVISRMTAQTVINGKDVLYPNGPTFDPSGKLIWARLSNIPGQAGVNEIGAGPVVYRTGIIIIQLFVPAGSGSKLITETADKLRELFEFQDDDRLSYQAVSSIAVGEKNGWFQLNLQIPYRAL